MSPPSPFTSTVGVFLAMHFLSVDREVFLFGKKAQGGNRQSPLSTENSWAEAKITLGWIVEDGANCAVTTHSTESGKRVKTVEYHPREANRGEYWAVIIPLV